MAEKNEVKITFKAFNQDFNKAVGEMDDEAKKLRQEMKLQEEQMKYTATETQKLESKIGGLQKQYDIAKQKTAATAEALAKAKELWGENSAEAQKMETQLKRNQIAEQQMANKITETTNALEQAKQAEEDYAKALKDLERLFEATDRSLEQFTDVLGQDLVQAIQKGTATTKQLEDAFQKVGKTAIGAGTDIDRIKETLRNLDTKSIDEVRQDLEKLSAEAKDAQESVSGLGTELASVVSGVAAGIGIGGIVTQALNADDLKTKIDITFEVPEQSKASVRQAVADVKAYGVDGQAALEGVRRQWTLNKDASDEANAAIVRSAAAITDAYADVDFTQLIQETNEIGKELNISDKEALNLVESLFKIGFPTEQLDIISEYGSQLRRAGFEAKEIKGIMAAAVNTGTWNIDNLLDGLKEGRIRAAEMGSDLSDGFKESIAEVTNNTKKMTDEQLQLMEESFEAQEEALSKSLDKQYQAAEKNMEKQQRELEKALDSELKQYEKTADAKIALIDKEYIERLKLIDEEEYKRLKAIDNQIDAINKQQEAADQASKKALENEKRQDLQWKVAIARTAKDKESAEKALAVFESQLADQRLREQRKEQINSLKEQKDNIKELYNGKKEDIKSEYELAKSKEEDALEIQKEAILERQQAEKDSFAERKKNYLESLRETHSVELEEFKKLNVAKLDVAKNPPDSALYTSTIKQLEDWGKAIAQGGEAGTQAYKDMIVWLDSIENATLRNTIGTELFGYQWEDQGDKIIASIMNADQELQKLEQSGKNASTSTGGIGENSVSGLTQLRQAVGDLTIALDPLFWAISLVVGALSKWVSNNPELAAVITSFVVLIGILAGAFVALAPAIAATPAMLPVIVKAFGTAKTAISSVIAVLPKLKLAFAAITSPIGIAVMAIALLVYVLIEYWEPISQFFIKLWSGIWNKIKSVGTMILNFLKNNWQTILAVITGPVGLIAKFIYDNWGKIKSTTFTVFTTIVSTVRDKLSGLKDAAVTPINLAREAIRTAIEKIKALFQFEFKWPKLKVPKFDIKGSINPLDWFDNGVPKIDIQWFAKGGIMTSPTIFGANGSTLLAGGEAGKEAILPLNERVLAAIGNAIYQASDNLGGQQIVYNYERMLEGAIFNVREEADITKIARRLHEIQQVDKRGR